MWFGSFYSVESLRGAYQLLHFDPHISDDDSGAGGDVDEYLDVDDDFDEVGLMN